MRSTEEIIAYYQRLSDERLRQIAIHESGDLSERGLEIIQDELERRGLLAETVEAIEVEVNGMDAEEFEEIVRQIIQMPCPECGKEGEGMKAGIVHEIRSFLLISRREARFRFGCADCVSDMKRQVARKNYLYGLWSSRGLLYTLRESIRIRNSEEGKRAETETGLYSLVESNLGFFQLNSENEPKVIDLLSEINRK